MFGTTSSADVAFVSATRLSSPAAPPAPVLLQPWHVLPRMATATKGGWRIASPEFMQYDTGTKYSMTVVCDLSITASSLYMSHTHPFQQVFPRSPSQKCPYSPAVHPWAELLALIWCPTLAVFQAHHRWRILKYHKYRVWSPITLDSLNQKPFKPTHTPPNDANQIIHHLRIRYIISYHGK